MLQRNDPDPPPTRSRIAELTALVGAMAGLVYGLTELIKSILGG